MAETKGTRRPPLHCHSPRPASVKIMRCLLLSILLSGSSAFMMAPAAVARLRSVVRAEKEGEAVAKKKGIPLALLIWPLIAVGDDVRGRVDKSTRVVRHRRARQTTHRPQTRRSTSRKSSHASRSRASRRPRCPTRTRTTSRSKFHSLFTGPRSPSAAHRTMSQ